jgi:hypothetical protein
MYSTHPRIVDLIKYPEIKNEISNKYELIKKQKKLVVTSGYFDPFTLDTLY